MRESRWTRTAWRLCFRVDFPLRNVEPFVQEKRPWIERTLRRMRESEEHFPPARLCDGGEVPYLGERLRLRVRVEPARSRAHVSRRGAELRVRLRPGRRRCARRSRPGTGGARAIEVAPRLDAAVARAGRSYSALQIRGQRTRWASCSTSGAMSFNWRLLLAPAEILDYVVEHEVAHLDVQDHSHSASGACSPHAAPPGASTRRGCGATVTACAYSQRKKRTARNSPAAAQAATTSAGACRVAAPAHDRRPRGRRSGASAAAPPRSP